MVGLAVALMHFDCCDRKFAMSEPYFQPVAIQSDWLAAVVGEVTRDTVARLLHRYGMDAYEHWQPQPWELDQLWYGWECDSADAVAESWECADGICVAAAAHQQTRRDHPVLHQVE